MVHEAGISKRWAMKMPSDEAQGCIPAGQLWKPCTLGVPGTGSYRSRLGVSAGRRGQFVPLGRAPLRVRRPESCCWAVSPWPCVGRVTHLLRQNLFVGQSEWLCLQSKFINWGKLGRTGQVVIRGETPTGQLPTPQQHTLYKDKVLVSTAFPTTYRVAKDGFPRSHNTQHLGALTCSRDTRIFFRFPLVSPLTSDSRLLSNTFELEKRRGESKMVQFPGVF